MLAVLYFPASFATLENNVSPRIDAVKRPPFIGKAYLHTKNFTCHPAKYDLF